MDVISESLMNENTTLTHFHRFSGRRVLVTGHTGFKGSWLCEWLLSVGAKVSGFSLPPPTDPSLFEQLTLAGRMDHNIGDVRDLETLRAVVRKVRPEFVFHLAAQPLVRLSYREPVQTFATNVMGTVNVLEAVRLEGIRCAVVVVTSDKCYENKEWAHSYREVDALGGYDPYSASKGAAELVVAAYRRSFFSREDSNVALASARAGNVIGGGDWAADRIVPDCIRSLRKGEPILVRNKHATRPWQHVLEPLGGYMLLASRLDEALEKADKASIETLCSGFNFGPLLTSNRSVGDLVREVLMHWKGDWIDGYKEGQPHEAGLLNLSIDKAYHVLRWQPVWDFETCVAETVNWYSRVQGDSASAPVLTRSQIDAYMKAMGR
jgi:CDP-glucose 4,6-dehydratase